MRTKLSLFPILTLISAAVAGQITFGEEMVGHSLSMRFVVQGAAPESKMVAVDKDKECCKPYFREVLLIGKDGALANVFVYLKPAEDERPPQNKAQLANLPKSVTILAKDCKFQPRCFAVHTSQELIIRNSDSVLHHSKLDTRRNQASGLIPTGDTTLIRFRVAEDIPCSLSCSVHPWMEGWVLVSDHTSFAISGTDGKLKISGLPAGSWRFVAWHEKRGWLAFRDGRGEIWDRKNGGKIDVKGDTDLGEIKIPIAEFTK